MSCSVLFSFGKKSSCIDYSNIIRHLKSGDLIEIPRGKFKHFAMFESVDRYNNYYCFHITTDEDDNAISHTSINLCKKILTTSKAILKYEPLLDILKNGDSKPAMCRINNQENMGQETLQMTNNQSPDLAKVFQTLHKFKDFVFKYSVESLNCEHYCTFWKYGIGWSSQVNTFKDIYSVVLKWVSLLAKVGSHVFKQFKDIPGCYIAGKVCLLISTKIDYMNGLRKEIDFTLTNLQIDNMVITVATETDIPDNNQL